MKEIQKCKPRPIRAKIGAAIFTLSVCLALAMFAWSNQITVQTPLGAYPGTVAAGDLDVTFTAAGASGLTSGVTFTITGGEILLVYHAGGVDDATFTMQSVADNLGRYGDIDYTLSQGEYAAFNFTGTQGWRLAGTTIASVSCATTGLQFAVLKYK